MPLTTYAAEADWVFSQKIDGMRVLAVVSNHKVTFLNRNGEPVQKTLVDNLRRELASLNGDWVFDGEYVNDTYYVFDMPSAGTVLSVRNSYYERRAALEAVFAAWRPPASWATGGRPNNLVLLPIARTQVEKLDLALKVYKEGGEGIICNQIDAKYQLGKRTRSMLKYKFIKDLDCVVVDKGREGKANLTLALYDDGQLKEICDCSALTGNGPRVEIGDVVTISYLAAYDPDNPRVSQPVRPLIRTDKKPEECLMSQVQFSTRAVLT